MSFQTRIPCTVIYSNWEVASVAYHQEVKSDHYCPLHLSIWVAKEYPMLCGTRWSNILVTWRKDRASSASSVPHGHGYSWQPPGHWLAHTRLMPQNEGPCPLPSGKRYGHMTHMLSRTKEHVLSLKQGKICPHEVTSSVQAVRTLPLGKSSSRPTAHAPADEWESKDYTQRTAFPNSSTFRVTLFRNSMLM